MGRLFWKFFALFWLAQLVTAIGVGVSIWMLRPDPEERLARLEDRPPEMMRRGPQLDRHPPGVPHRRPPWRSPAFALLVGGVVSLGFAALLAWSFTRRIRTLQGAFAEVADGHLAYRVGDGMGRGRDELSTLGGDFDRMAGRLQNVVEVQKRLLHDVSHELRSPLARLQAAIELARQQPERTGELVGRIEKDCQRIDALVGEILTLSRIDVGQGIGAEETIDLGELLAGIVDDARFEAQALEGRGMDFRLDMKTSPVRVRGNPDLLQRAFENVVRNALLHGSATATGRRGHVDVVVEADRERVRVEVADTGPGVAPADIDRLFEPFFRGGRGDQRGHGLGLAITRRVIEAHRGQVSALNRAEGGLVVSLVLPRAIS